MAPITNWAQVGASAHEGDMDRARLALEAARVRQSAQAQRFDQQRTMALDAEARAASERAYRDQREDLAYNRLQAERSYNDQRADVAFNRQRNAEQEAYNRGRQERMDELALAREQRFGEAQAFNQYIQQEEQNRRQALFQQQQEEYTRALEEREAMRQQTETSFANLLTQTMRNGDRDARGYIYAPTWMLETFTKQSGQPLAGLVIATKGMDGKDLPFPQIMLREQVLDTNGKPVVGQDGQTPQYTMTPMPMAQVRALFAAYPDMSESLGGFPQEAAWKAALGFTDAPVSAGKRPSGGGASTKAVSATNRAAETLQKQIDADVSLLKTLYAKNRTKVENTGDADVIATLEKRISDNQKKLNRLNGVPEEAVQGDDLPFGDY